MSPLAQKPIIHGRDHACGGADPIPGICDMLSIPAAGDLTGAMFDPGYLEAWWRLGEDPAYPSAATSTANFMLDSSGNNYHLAALNQNAAATTVVVGPGNARLPVTNVTGALTGGDPALNDGGIKFVWNEYQWSSWGEKLCLQAPAAFEEKAFCDGTGGGYTLACWIAFVPSTDTVNEVAPNTVSTVLFRPLFGNFHYDGSYIGGFWVGFDPYTGVMKLDWYGGNTVLTNFNYVSSFGFVPYQWYFFAMTLAKTGASYTRRILLNLNEVATATGGEGSVGTTGSGTCHPFSLTAGGTYESDFRFAHGAGQLDELAIWGTALDDAQLSAVYTATVGAAAGSVPVSDGAGGVTWTVPPAATFDPATAASWWFPLVDSDGTCVLDGTGNLIPTLMPI